MSILFARVAVENTAYHFDRTFDYLVPEALLEQAKPGCRALVPFGAGNSPTAGDDFRDFPGKENPKRDETSGGGAG